MCQPKNKGGKRCLVHSAASKFVVRVAHNKTGADEGLIKATLSELNKEGKHYPQPSIETVDSWIDSKRFATQFDPELDSKEKNLQLKQLEKASDEVKAGVTGGHFHAWKNLVKRVKAKISKPFIAFTLAGALATGLGGCMQGSPVNPPAPTGTAPISQVYGDSVFFVDIADQYGNYQQVSVSPEDDAMKLNPGVVDQSVYDAGFTEDQVLSAQQFAAKFVVEEGIDSSALDTGAAGYNEWVSTKGNALILESERATVLAGSNDGSPYSPIIYNNADEATGGPVLIRDGKPRVSNVNVSVTSVDGGASPVGNYVRATMQVDATYRVSDENLVSYLKKTNPTLSDEQLRAVLKDDLFDGTGENAMLVSSTRTIGMTQNGDSWLIGGYRTDYAAINANVYMK